MLKRRDYVLDKLRSLKSELQAKYPLEHLWVFGSVARDEADENSDLDLLYELNAPMDLDLMSLWDDLETAFACKVDLGSRNNIKPILKPYIEEDMINVF